MRLLYLSSAFCANIRSKAVNRYSSPCYIFPGRTYLMRKKSCSEIALTLAHEYLTAVFASVFSEKLIMVQTLYRIMSASHLHNLFPLVPKLQLGNAPLAPSSAWREPACPQDEPASKESNSFALIRVPRL
jgi:hypothetical protein